MMYENFKLSKTEYGTIEAYLWHVEDPKKVVCIIHGIGEYAGRYDRVAQRLMQDDIAVVSMDLRGHGLTDGPRGHCAPRAKVLDDITMLLEYVKDKYPRKDIVMYGHSMGGNITLDYRSRGALNDLPKAYLITSPWITLVRSIPAPVYRLVKVMAKIAPSFGIHSNVDEELLGNPEQVKPYNDNPLVFKTLDKAIQANPDAHPLFHSDRGFQYTNRTFHHKLVQAGMTQSMSRVAHCIDNGPMEGFWGILKRERYYGRRFTSKRELVQMIETYVHYYNTRRVQRSLGILTPMEKHTLCLAA